ncbi:ferredoxin [Streptomyces sp. NBC_00285]
MKLTVDEPKCVGAGQCALIAPTSLITGKRETSSYC